MFRLCVVGLDFGESVICNANVCSNIISCFIGMLELLLVPAVGPQRE